MGWWEDLGNAVGDVVDAAADVVQAVVETTADAAADVVETAGNAAQEWLGQFGGPMAWLGGVISGITNVAGAVIKLAAGLVSGILGGVIRIIGGILVLDEELIIKGLLDIFMGIGGGLVYLAGMILSFMQKLIPVQNAERKLTKEEKDMLERIFMNSISLHNVRIVEGAAGAYGSGRSATTVGNTIYMREIVPGTLSFRSTLVHECVHVWQYQNLGSRYTFEALLAQGSWPKEGDSNPGYNWEFVELGRGNTDWNKFNKEAQAEFIQDVWRVGTLTFGGNTRDGSGAFFDLQEVEGLFSDATAEFVYTGVDDSEHPLAASSTIPMDYTDIATKAVRSLRGRINLRLSKTIWSGN